MTADVEDQYTICQATEPVDENNCFVNERITCRRRNGDHLRCPPTRWIM